MQSSSRSAKRQTPRFHRGRAAFGLLCVVVGLALALGASTSTQLTCARQSGNCVIQRSTLLGKSEHPFPIQAISEVRWVTRSGKGNKVTGGGAALLDRRGAETRLEWSDLDEGRQKHDEIARFFAKGSSVASLHVQLDASIWGMLLAIGFIVVGLVVGVQAFRAPGAKRVEAAPASESDPDPDSELAVSHGPASHGPASRAAASPGATGLRGWWSSRWKSSRQTIIFVGVIAVVAIGGQVALELYAHMAQGFLEVRCSHRCRFDGAECLPGGSYRMSLDPGRYMLEVFDPSQASGWRPVPFQIEQGAAVSIECRPGAHPSRQ
jgi:hypothetical protein